MAEFDLYLDNDTVQELAEAADRNLAAPTTDENPTFRAGKEPGLGTWSEVVTVRDTAISAPKKGAQDGSEMVFKITLEINGAEGGGFAKNAGKTHYYNGFIDKGALLNKSDERHGLNARRLGTINSLLKAVGVDFTGGVAYKDWFSGNEKPLVGQKVVAVVRKYKYTNKDTKEEVTNTEVDGFLPANLS